MELYRPGTCIWCWDMDRSMRPAEFVLVSHESRECLCAACQDQLEEMVYNFLEDGWGDSLTGWSVERYEPEKVLWHRGQKIQVVRPSRPRQTGTVIHSYLSRATFEWMVNCVIDGRKWPAAFPARLVQEYVPTRKVA